MLGKLLCTSLIVLAVSAQKSKIPCGLPPFVSKLPVKQAQQLNETWANYTNGSECAAEQKRTFEIIGSLTEAERDAVFETKEEPSSGLHKKLRDYAKDNFNDEQKAGFEEWITGIVNAKKAVEERISKLSPSAKEMLDKIIKVRQEERRLLSSLSPELSKELYGLI
ncbi:hypothetical protein ANCDUO_19361 [Ancylostoma duodenale]|uniref:SXP/RAL-2 family protein Ani s 5-like cation-binding domain-containing protein n=1 Tax=Ancylostoma duodenale TaxID=51022 RepID=A0A0C2FPU1_9BILA|nr:hypothetical protein ANCDUO_19361 [Ancylostoma duodenale]